MKKLLVKLTNKFSFWYEKINELRMKLIGLKKENKEKYITKRFKRKLGYEIDFNKKAETFNQKIQFRKLYDDNPLYAICADKYRVREYVKKKIGEKYLIPLYLVTDKLTIEQWEQLPNSFVAKANHNSGPVQVVKNKREIKAKDILKELNNQLRLDYGILSMEKWYSAIPRKIIIEKFLVHDRNTLEDFKFHVFNGKKIIVEHIYERKNNEIYECLYDRDWNRLDIAIGAKVYDEKICKPKNFLKMLEIAEKLSEDFDYARIDLYNIEGKIYFGEITFSGDSGFGKFTDESWDYKFGEYWEQKI